MQCLFLFQKTGESSGWVSSAATGSGALVGVGVAIKNNRNKNNRSRHMSNSNNNNNNNQSTASSSHRRLHSSSSIKMMTSQSHLCGIDNEAFVLTPTDNNTCCANVAYDYTNDDYDVRDNEDQIGSLCCLSVPRFKFAKKIIYAHLAT